MKLVVFVLLGNFLKVDGCASLGGGTDSQIFTNPTLTWTMNPPSAWTFPEVYAQTTQQYFPGQPLTQADATNQATGDMTAAVLEALSASNLPTTNVKVVSNYQPQMISDCVKIAGTTTGIPTQIAIGGMFGVVEQQAVTQIATATAAVDPTACAQKTYAAMVTLKPNIVQGGLTIDGLTVSGLQLKQVVAQIQNTLNFNYHVRFINPITYA